MIMNKRTSILILGKKGTGRKTLLQHAEQDLQEQSYGSLTIWHNKQVQFILPNKPLDEALCQDLKPFQPIQSVLITMDVPNLVTQETALEDAKEIAQQLACLRKQQKKFELNIALTQCDRVYGFKEFFANLNIQERKKILGTHSPQDFETLLKEVNAQIIARLHQETLSDKRKLIQLFPAQLEKLIEHLHAFTAGISSQSALYIKNTYFTSSKQKNKSIDLLGNRDTILPPTINDKPYFIADMMAQLINDAETHKLKTKRLDIKRWVTLPVCIMLVIGFIVSWHISYQNTSITLKQIESNLQKKPNSPVKPAWLAKLNLLSTSIKELNNPSLKYSHLIGFSQTNKLKKKLILLYQTQLHTQFLPYIEGILSDTIVHNMNHNKLNLYNALKIYLMLTEQEHYDKKNIVNWFTLHWHKQDPQQQQLLLHHLSQLLALQNKNWPRNQPLIDQAQQVLQQLPIADIIFLELQGNYKNQTLPLASMLQHHDNLDLSKAQIPSLFSPDHFKEIYNHQIPSLVSTFSQGNWVIGKPTAHDNDPQQQNKLIADVRALYLQYLSQAWQAIIPDIKLKKPQNFADVQSLIHEITSPQSSLTQILEFASGNANLNKQLKASASLQLVSQFLQQKEVYTKAVSALQALSSYLKAIVSSDDINKASYNTAISILNSPDQPNPIGTLLQLQLGSPIQSWLNTVAQGSWNILLQNSKIYLDNIWSNTVVPTYLSNINNRYPLNPTSDENISLNHFSDFLGPDGTMDVFFNYYLKPFVDMSSNYWLWQSLYGQSINMPQNVLDMFMRASLIQQMFFADDHQKMSFKFSLIPVAKSKSIRAVTINIEGQIQQYTSAHHSGSILTWPGPNAGQVSITTSFYKGDDFTQSFDGPWALFRLIQSATLTPTNNPQKYTLKLKFGKATATYHLITDNRINPFIPDILNKFHCPDSLNKSGLGA